MPTYQLRCARCNRLFEMEESLNAYERKKSQGIHCPSCNATEVKPELSIVEVKTTRKS